MKEKHKKALKEMVDFICQQCKQEKEESQLEIHRIIRGNKGGEYTPNNILVLCKKCHKLMHSGEYT